MEHSLLNSNFIGRDGFRWWIGQIAPDEYQRPQTKTKDGWGNRYKVRIMGYHPYNTVELPDEDLPWAQVLLPPGYGTGSACVFKTVRYQQGDTVMGFFLDGDNAQLPIIFGAMGNSRYRADEGDPLPFRPYTGYTGTLKKPSKKVLKDANSNENIVADSPRNLSAKDAKKVGKVDGNEAYYSKSTGKVINIESGATVAQASMNKMKTAIGGFVDDLSDLKSELDPGLDFSKNKINDMISERTEQLSGLSSGIVGSMTNNLYKNMAPQLGTGVEMLYDTVFATVFAATKSRSLANTAGVAAQKAMIPPISNLDNLLPCLTNKIMGNLKDSLKGILQSVADNVDNYVECVGDQAVGAVVNSMIGQITDGMSESIGGLSKITSFLGGFSVEGMLRNGVDSLLGMAGMGDCNKPTAGSSPANSASKYKIGYGPIMQDDLDLSAIMNDANAAKAISDAAKIAGAPLDAIQQTLGGFSLLSGAIKGGSGGGSSSGSSSKCFAGVPSICSPPKINIFGGGGKEAEALPFYGNIMGDQKKTGSIIGIKVTNPGNGYTYPPFVEIVDNCKQGFGAIARATVKDGKVDSIYVVSEGENYPVEDITPPIVTDIIIINPGSGYEEEDKVIDDLGNEYDTKIYAGSIIKVTPINSKDITEIPILSVISKTGTGAILKANLDLRSEFQGEVEQVIDCIKT